jgi:hypothetical protein
MNIHIASSDTFQIGIGWLNEKDYGEGGLFIMIGYRYINFWKKVDISQCANNWDKND